MTGEEGDGDQWVCRERGTEVLGGFPIELCGS